MFQDFRRAVVVYPPLRIVKTRKDSLSRLYCTARICEGTER